MAIEDGFEITGVVVKQTDKAIQFDCVIRLGSNNKEIHEQIWLPKSQIEIYDSSVIIPQWLFDAKEGELAKIHKCEVTIL